MYPVDDLIELLADASGKALQLAHFALHTHSDPKDKV